MKIEIGSLSLRNFKGVKNLRVPELGKNPQTYSESAIGKNIQIYGDNATGKTTIVDAFFWLLFGKDSKGATTFNLKPIDADGNEVHMLDTTVTAQLIVTPTGEIPYTIIISKTFKENWVKKRGSNDKSFEGHVTECAIDGVPMAAKAFQEKIALLIPESDFRLLTNPIHFNETLTWQERRKTLLAICGEPTAEEVAEKNPALAELLPELKRNTADEIRARLKATQTKINTSMKEIPARVDELKRSIPNIKETAIELLHAITGYNAEIERAQEKLASLTASGAKNDLLGRKANIERALQDRANASLTAYNRKLSDATSAVQSAERILENGRSAFQSLQNQRKQIEQDLAAGKKRENDLRNQYATRKAEVLTTPAIADICPTCSQPIPAYQIEDAATKAEAAFNEAKANDLADIVAKGKTIKAQNDALELSLVQIDAKIFDGTEALARTEAELNAKCEARTAIAGEKPVAKLSPEEVSELDAIDKALADGENDTAITSARNDIQDAIRAIETERNAKSADLARLQAGEKATERIAELVAEEKRLSGEYEETLRKLDLLEKYTDVLISFLEEKVASRFSVVRFKLYDRQVNGEIKPCCESMLNGVPYPAINNAGKIQVGFDIIKTLSEVRGFTAPIFVDNNESVTRLPEMAAQVIGLFVSEADEELRVEMA